MVQELPPGGYPVTPSFLRRLRAMVGKDRKEWQALGIGKRTWRWWNSDEARERYEAGNPVRVRPSNILSMAKALGITLEQLLHDPITDFDTLAGIATEIDAFVMEVTRALRDVDLDRIRSAYHSLMAQQTGEYDISVQDYLDRLTDPSLLAQIATTIPGGDLTLRVGKDFEAIEFVCRSGSTLVVESPKLLWDCHCRTPGTDATEADCPIHSHPAGEEVSAAFGSGYVSIEWDGLRLLWKRTDALWPPSVDSFRFMRNLSEEGVLDSPITSVLDLGSGTGFLGIAIAANNPSVRRVDLSDWLLTPALYGAANWALNKGRCAHALLQPRVGLFTEWLDEPEESRPYDLVVCNPPYLPLLPGFERVGIHAVVAGTDLLTSVISHARAIGHKVYVQFSHLAAPEAMSAAEAAGLELRPLVGGDETVPFRVKHVWKDPEYLQALIEKRQLVVRSGNRHPYWHHLQAYSIEDTRREIGDHR